MTSLPSTSPSSRAQAAVSVGQVGGSQYVRIRHIQAEMQNAGYIGYQLVDVHQNVSQVADVLPYEATHCVHQEFLPESGLVQVVDHSAYPESHP